jgi:N-methylhydantoinase A
MPQSQELSHRAIQKRKQTSVVPVEHATVLFHNKSVRTPVFEREDLVRGRRMTGPAVITEYSATTVITPDKTFWIDGAENLVISIK